MKFTFERAMRPWRSVAADVNRQSEADQARSLVILIVSASLFAAVCALSWFGYVATREWTRGADLLQQRRTTEALALVSAALSRDMKGGWTTLLAPIDQQSLEEDPPYELLQPTARAFARFPYPESTFVWKPADSPQSAYVFNRTDRLPPWATGAALDEAFPISLVRGTDALQPMLEEIRLRAADRPVYTTIETTIGHVPYQVVVHYIFGADAALVAVVGFTINMEWVRHEYFGPLLTEVSRIGGNEQVLALEIRDDRGSFVAAAGDSAIRAGVSHDFPLLFLDAGALPDDQARAYLRRPWHVMVAPSSDSTLQRATLSAERTFAMVVIAAAISLLSLLLAIRSVRASAAAADMKSEFVSAVTHELKTPLQSIRLVGDTLRARRYSSPEKIREYAVILSEEATRLTHAIDNLLAFARYASEPLGVPALDTDLDVHDTVEAALEPFRPTLEQQGFTVCLQIPSDLPRIAADRAALVKMMQNIIDNAIKYSPTVKALDIRVGVVGHRIEIAFADQGIGVLAPDLPHIFDKFYRGRNNNVAGSGLGLAIAKRIVTHHGGTVSVASTGGQGTTVTISLPVRAHA